MITNIQISNAKMYANKQELTMNEQRHLVQLYISLHKNITFEDRGNVTLISLYYKNEFSKMLEEAKDYFKYKMKLEQ